MTKPIDSIKKNAADGWHPAHLIPDHKAQRLQIAL
jgi:hypothetical protein